MTWMSTSNDDVFISRLILKLTIETAQSTSWLLNTLSSWSHDLPNLVLLSATICEFNNKTKLRKISLAQSARDRLGTRLSQNLNLANVINLYHASTIQQIYIVHIRQYHGKKPSS